MSLFRNTLIERQGGSSLLRLGNGETVEAVRRISHVVVIALLNFSTGLQEGRSSERSVGRQLRWNAHTKTKQKLARVDDVVRKGGIVFGVPTRLCTSPENAQRAVRSTATNFP